MFNKIKSLLGKTPQPEAPDMPDVGAINGLIPHLPMLGLSGFGLRNGSYDNTYPSIARIADAIAEVTPLAINANGEEVKNANVLNVLNHPNKEMCAVDFMDTLAVMLLVHPKVYLLAWQREGNQIVPGGRLTEQNLGGLTFMEGVSERIINGVSEYSVNGRVFSESEVISLSLAVNPYHISDGYSPSVASKKWATTDDYIAEFHNAQFRNNARPAGMLTVVADSVEEFNDTVDIIEAKFRGASNAGNTVYNMRPSQTLDGKPAPAKIEWTPFAQTNKELTLEAVYNQANRKMESVFGVPEEVRGHLQNSNYASAEVADYVFSRRVIYPMLVKIYAKLTHEFNRIFGGMGYALTFHYETPMLTDTRKLQAEALKTMLDAGFSVESSVEALRLPESYKALQRTQDTSDGGDKGEAGAVAKCDPTTPPYDPNSGASPTTVSKMETPTTEQKAENDEDEGELPKAKEELTSPNLIRGYDELIGAVNDILKGELPYLLSVAGDSGIEDDLDAIEAELKRNFVENDSIKDAKQTIYGALDSLRVAQSVASEQELSAQLGVEVNSVSIFADISKRIEEQAEADLYDSYRSLTYAMLNKLALIIYNIDADDPTERERQALEELEKLPEQEHYRAVRFGFTEQQLAIAFTAQAIWEWAQNEYRFKGYKVWHISPLSPAPCEECRKINGERVRLTENFSNGLPYPPYHPNCYCYVEYTAEREDDKAMGRANAIGEQGEADADAKPTIKITCPQCGRFLMDAEEAKIEKMICPNTKCKARLAIDSVKGGATIVNIIEEEQ